MAPGRKRGGKGAKTKSELSLGDLVLAKVKGFPAWPAKISKPEDWKRAPDPKKHFVQFFGTEEIAFVAPADIQAFTSESRNKLSARCQGKTVKYFAQAVKEISEEFEELQCKSLSGVRDDSNAENLSSERQSVDPALDETSDVSVKNGKDSEGPNCKSETKGLSDLDPGLDCSTEIPGEMDGQTVKPCSSNDTSNNLSPHISSVDRNKLSNGDQNALTNGHQPTVTMDSKKKHAGANRRNSDLVTSHKHHDDGVQIKNASDDSRLDLGIINGRKGKKLLKGKKHLAAADDGKDEVDAQVISEENNEVISRKKMKFQHYHEKQTSRTIGASLPPKIDAVEGKRVISSSKAKLSQSSTNMSNHSSDEDDFPPTKRQRRALGLKSVSNSVSETRLGNSTSHKNGSTHPNKVTQLPAKRRAVRICDDDEDDELPKTPIHLGSTHKASDIPHVSDSKKKNVKREETNENGHMVARNTAKLRDEFKDPVKPSQVSDKALSPTAQHSMENSTPEISAKIDTEKTPFLEAKPVAVSPESSPQSIAAARPLLESRKKQLTKAPSSIYQKKVSVATDSNRLNSSVNQSAIERSKPTSSGEKKKTTPKPYSQTNDSVVLVDNTDESVTSHGERLDGSKLSLPKVTNFSVDLAISDSATSMKNLIAAAQARKRQANLHNSYGNPLHLLLRDTEMLVSPASAALAVESRNVLQLDVQGHPTSPSFNVRQLSSISGHENEDVEEMRVNSGGQATGCFLSGDTEAAVARDSFEGMIETLSRTKESIGRATRLAIDCAKYGISNEVVELLIRKLESEPSLHRKVDLFFLVDSITQCSHSQKGVAGESYIPIVQAALPRLIGAAAPPGAGAQENRRQCRKVLRLWFERKIFPESVLRRYMDDLGAVNDGLSNGFPGRRPSRAERAIDDPIREMEGMFVDEYGSNTTFQLPGFLSSNLFEQDDGDDDNFPSKLCKEVSGMSPSEHTPASKEPENCTITPSDRRHRILEDVDGELEMEDVSIATTLEPNSDVKFQSASNMSELLPSPEGSPPLPPGPPPLTPPLPTSPPPSPPPPPPPSSSPPPPPPPPPPSSQQITPPPNFGPPCVHSLPSQPVSISHHAPPVQSTSQPSAYHPPRGEISSQQSSFFSPAAGCNARELVGYNSSRPIEHRQNDVCINHQASQLRQQLRPSNTPFAPPQQLPNQFAHPNSVMQHHYPPYGPRRYSTDEQWRMPTADLPYAGWNSGGQSFSGQPYSHEGGYFGPPSGRTPSSAIDFRPPASSSAPAAAPNSVHSVPMMPCRPDMPAVNWRPV